MKKITKLFLYLIMFGLPFIVFSQQKTHVFFDESWQVSTTKYNQYYVCECFVLENGAYDGPFICYDNVSETKLKEYNFSNNVLDGEVFEYFIDGKLKLHAYYDNGVPVKEWKEWNSDGDLVVDKIFDKDDRILTNKKKFTDYEKKYFDIKEFEAPVYSTKCIFKKVDKEKYKCSNEALLEYYKHPPLPPFYKRPGTFIVKLKYLISEKGKVSETELLESSGDEFLDDLAETHVLNMIPFESAKKNGNPIDFWIVADIIFEF